MVYFINTVIILIAHIVFIRSLVQLPEVEDNNIAITEKIIRDTTNKLFAALKVRDLGSKSKLKQYLSVHNFFVSITLKDSDNLKEIARLTRVNNVDKNTKHFITQINAVLDEGNTVNDDIYLHEHLGDIFIRRLRHFNTVYKLKGYLNINSNSDELKYINNPVHQIRNVRENRRRSFNRKFKADSIEFWEHSSRRIYKGNRATIKDFPFMASILIFNQFQCAGSIIKSDLVITSASCLQLAWNNRLYRENPSFLTVRIGSDYTMISGEVIPVIEIEFQPLYDPKTLQHNLAVIRLTKHIFFENSRKVRKIDIDRTPRPLGEGDTGRVIIVGWGATDIANAIKHPIVNRLKYAELDYYPLEDCDQAYKKHYVTKRNFCAGFFSQGGGACDHDVGGPGIVDDVLMGVISFGSGSCGKPDSPTVFTKVGFYADWIDEIIDKEVPSSKKLLLKKHVNVSRQVEITTTMRTTFTFQPIIPQNSTINTVDVVEEGLFTDYLQDVIESVNSGSLEKLRRTHLDAKTKSKMPTGTLSQRQKNDVQAKLYIENKQNKVIDSEGNSEDLLLLDLSHNND